MVPVCCGILAAAASDAAPAPSESESKLAYRPLDLGGRRHGLESFTQNRDLPIRPPWGARVLGVQRPFLGWVNGQKRGREDPQAWPKVW